MSRAGLTMDAQGRHDNLRAGVAAYDTHAGLVVHISLRAVT